MCILLPNWLRSLTIGILATDPTWLWAFGSVGPGRDLFQLSQIPCVPDWKKYSLVKDKYFCEDSSIHYLRSKIFEYAQ